MSGDGIRRTFQVAAQKTIEATRATHIMLAKREHGRVMNDDPRPTSFQRYVDGRVGAPEESVRPGGVIVYRYPRLELVAQFALETLFELSPVLSGEYRMGHRLFLNGKEVASLAAYKSGDEVAVTNYLPYARKIEIGKMTMRVSGSSRVYAQARRRVMARFGNVASVDFTFRGLIGTASGAGTLVNPTKAKGRAHNKSELRYPVLIIREL